MTYDLIISPEELALHLDDPHWVIVDSRFSLADSDKGQADYLKSHIAGAVYAHLNEDLSGPIIPGVTGRHPLPDIKEVSVVFTRLGICEGIQVVAYDDMSGALAAGRVWWLLCWLGHEAVAVLDGGWQGWIKNGLPVRSGLEVRSPCGFTPHPRQDLVVDAGQVDRMRQDPKYKVLDARSADRFKGENEIIDPIAGHIPGAVSAAYAGNLNPDGTFRRAGQLARRYKRILDGTLSNNTAVYCGSGVTATHDILAMMIAGLGEAKLYAGSYSEWITDPKHPVEK